MITIVLLVRLKTFEIADYLKKYISSLLELCLFLFYRQLKDILHRCDRAMIYVFIAGSYFPWLTLEQLPYEGWASHMRWIVWFLAIAGISYQQIFHEKYKMLETVFYVTMGIGPIFPILTEVSTIQVVKIYYGSFNQRI